MVCLDQSIFTNFGFKKLSPTVYTYLETTLYYIILEFVVLVAVTHLIHFVLRRFGQSIVISAIFAGIVTGKTGLSRARVMNDALIQGDQVNLSNFADRTGVFFMLLIALNLDLKYIWRNRRRMLLIAAASTIISIVMFVTLIRFTDLEGNYIHMLFYFHTSSPIAVRIITELKLVPTNIGQLAIGSALANDLACIVLVMFTYNFPRLKSWDFQIRRLILTLFAIGIILFVLRPCVRWLNRRNRQRRYIRNYQFSFILVFLVYLMHMAEYAKINGVLVFFLIGSMFPRDGPTIRTLKDNLRYIVHNFILPVYFGWISSGMDLIDLYNKIPSGGLMMFAYLLLNMIITATGKVGGTIAVATYLKIPLQESIPLGFILNVKGNVDIVSVSMVSINTIGGYSLGTDTFTVILMITILNTLLAGAAGRILARKMNKKFKGEVAQGLKKLELEEEVHVLACVHKPIEIPGILTLARLSINGVSNNPFNILLQHIIGLPKNYNCHTLFYNQRPENDNLDDEESLGHEYKDVPRVNACVDAFTKETGISVQQIILASFYDKMHKLLCQDIYNFHRNLVLIPSHKEQRYDGKMICRKEERRRLNLKLLKEAPCTVGILMDRPITGGILHGYKETDANINNFSPKSNIVTPILYHVVAIFCGGPDDQEAVEYAGRLAMHPLTDVTVVRFLLSKPRVDANVSTQNHMSMTYSSFSREIAMVIHKDADERDRDEEFLINFQQRFVATSKVNYIEKYANNGTDIEAELKSMMGMYSLFIVGRGRQPTALMAGLSEWQECIEIGPIGDMLSSDAFMKCGSVLIIQSPVDRLSNKNESLIGGIFQ